jgi:hypothetical protein
MVSTSNQPEINTNIIDQMQSTLPGAVTAITAVMSEFGNYPIVMQNFPHLPGSETIRNAGKIYWSY